MLLYAMPGARVSLGTQHLPVKRVHKMNHLIDPEMRMAYCEEFEQRCVEDPDFPRKLVMMDESACDLDGKKLYIH
jgi:hypothetical protein